MQLDECSTKIDAFQEKKSGILGLVSEYNRKKTRWQGFDLSLSLKDQLTKMNEQMGLKDWKKGYSSACDQLILERQNVTSDIIVS